MRTFTLLAILFYSNIAFGQTSRFLDSIKVKKQARLDTMLSVIKVKKGEVIADIGSGVGYNIIRLANSFPPVTYYVQDIDTASCNRNKFLKTIKTYNSKVSIDSFRFFRGTSTSTNLPKDYFDKVFMIAVLHEFTEVDLMLKDVKTLLKENGEFIIEEPLVNIPIKKEKGCNNPYFTESQLKAILERNEIVIIEEKYIKDDGKNRYRKIYRCKEKGYS